MKVFGFVFALLFGVVAFSAADVNAQGFADTRTPQAIEQKLFKEILRLPYYGMFDHISFELNGSTVILSGKVYNGINREGAERAARKIAGVSEVVNNIELLSGSGFDNAIRRQLVREFSRTGGIYRYLLEPNPSIRLIVDNGHVTLEGFVSNRSDSDLANILARGTNGVFSVTNNLIVGKERYR